MTQIIPAAPKETGRECRFAVYVQPPEYGMQDMHFIKEVIHYDDGTTTPNTEIRWDFERPFWTTKKGFQNHKQKKEWELIDNLIANKSTQSKLVDNAARQLGMPYFKGNLRRLAVSPYLYGADVLSTVVIKKEYLDAYPHILATKYNAAIFDTEADVVNGTNQITIATVTYREVCYTVVQADYLAGLTDVQARVDALMDKYLGHIVKKRNLTCELLVVQSEFDVVAACLAKLHQLKPDFMAIWNMDYDIPKIIDACARRNIDPKTIFSDPSVPEAYQKFNYIQGPDKKVTASGLVTPIKPAARWHTVECPSSFYVIDAMCVFKHNRTGQPEKQSYSLDFILHDVLGERKLKFEETSQYTGLKWHQVMQTSYRLEYIIYNRWDCLSMEELDENTKDLAVTLPMFCGFSDFMNYKSQPRRAVDNLHYFLLEQKNMVIGTTSGEIGDDPMDKMTVGLDGWIITLPAHMVADNGLKCIEEYPDLATNIRPHVGDLDVAAAYPNNECVMNISKETTVKELCKIEGIELHTQKMQGINLAGGHTNAIEFCTEMFSFPSLITLQEHFTAKHSEPSEEILLTV